MLKKVKKSKVLISMFLILFSVLLSSCTNLNNKNKETCDISKFTQSELTVKWEFMLPTFKDWDKIKYIKNYYSLCKSKPKIWDIIIYNKKDNTNNKWEKWELIPRIIKINSESSIEFKWSNLLLNWSKLKNSEWKAYKITKPVISKLSENITNKHIPKDSYLIFEDNIFRSDDSRKFWIITESEILWKVIKK